MTSWKVASGKDLLFVRPDAVFNKIKPISGGIPHCFPQFGPGVIQQVLFFTVCFLHLNELCFFNHFFGLAWVWKEHGLVCCGF